MHATLEILGGVYLIVSALATLFPKATVLHAIALDIRKLWDVLSPEIPPQ